MHTFMIRDKEGKKRNLMERTLQGEKIQLMKRDKSESIDNNLQQKISVQINSNLDNNSSNFNYSCNEIDNTFGQVLNPIKYNHFISNKRININGSLCYEDSNLGIKLLFERREIQLTNFIIQAEKKQIKDDGKCREILYVMQCKLIGQVGILKRIKLHSKDLISSEWIKNALGIEYSIYDNNLYKYLEIYIGKLFVTTETEIKYEHVGWRIIGNKWVYLHGGGVIGGVNFDTKGKYDKVIEIDYTIDKKQALRQSLNMLEISDYYKTIPMFLYTQLSVLKEIFEIAGAKPNFLLWLEGLTGSRKTSTAKIFFNIFNRSKDYISANFKDTINALEEKSFQYKDSILVLDDFFRSIAKNEWNYIQQVASEMIRRYGDNFSKGRLNKNMNRGKEYPPRGMLVVTGESTIKGESTVSRYLSIGIEKNDINLEILKYHQENPKLFSTHLYYFIEWISNNSEKVITYIKKNFRDLRNKNQGKYKHGRFIETLTFYELTCNIFLEYCIKVGLIDKEKKDVTFNEWNKLIYEAILIHEKANLQENPAVMYLQALQELICCGGIKLNSKDKKGDKNVIGYEDEVYYYLSSELTLQQIIKYWNKLSIEFSATNEMISKALDVLGVIKITNEGGKIRRTLKISGDSRRFLIINKIKMEEIINEIN